MKGTVERLHENRQIELAKSILEANGYTVIKDPMRESKLNEAGKNSSYTISLGHYRTGSGMSFKSESELIKFLKGHYVDPAISITYEETVTDRYSQYIQKAFHTDIKDRDKSKEMFKKGYVEI